MLDGEKRQEELARMLSGRVTDRSLKHAEEMLEIGQRRQMTGHNFQIMKETTIKKKILGKIVIDLEVCKGCGSIAISACPNGCNLPGRPSSTAVVTTLPSSAMPGHALVAPYVPYSLSRYCP